MPQAPNDYGTCPLCKETNPYNTRQQIDVEPDYHMLRCGACDGTTLQLLWKKEPEPCQ